MRPHARLLIVPVILIAASLACNFHRQETVRPRLPPRSISYIPLPLNPASPSLQAGSSTPLADGNHPFPTFSLLTPTPLPAPVILCEAAAFVKDVTISDGTTLGRGANFTKTWRIQNVGTCSWSPSFSLVFAGGDQMNAPASVGLS